MDFHTIIGSIISGIVSGIIVTIMFFIIKYKTRPKIELSKQFVYWKREVPISKVKGEKEWVYQMKFINHSRYNIENISVDIFLMRDYYQGSNKNYHAAPIANYSLKFLKGTKDKSKDLQDNCVVVTIKKDIFDILDELENDDWIHVQIVAYHSISGFRKVAVGKYSDPANCIVKNKKFESGMNFNLLNV